MKPAAQAARLRALALAMALALSTPFAAKAGRPAITEAMRPYVSVDAKVVALVHARVIDGTGAPAREAQTIVLRDGLIAAVGADGAVPVPPEAKLIDATGKSVLPGLVQLHEHLWMYGGSLLGVGSSYPKLFLASGVTAIRTTGSYNPYIDLRVHKEIESGAAVGPWMDLTIYMDLFGAPRLLDARSTRNYLDFWLDAGFTSVKAYGYTNRTALKEAIRVAHARGLKVTGHLCKVSYSEAADLGIDNIEHGFAMVPDFVRPAPAPAVKTEVVDPHGDRECSAHALHGLENVDPDGPQARALIDKLVKHKVAITSTLPALEDLIVDIPEQQGIDMLAPQIQDYHRQFRANMRKNAAQLVLPAASLRKTVAMERAFMKAGGLLVSGTDPAVPSGGVVAGYSNARQLELMVEHGFTPLEAIRVSTLNGATYLGRQQQIGSIAAGKQADLFIVEGDPSTRISDVRKVVTVFRQGVGYDPEALKRAVRGKVGLQ